VIRRADPRHVDIQTTGVLCGIATRLSGVGRDYEVQKRRQLGKRDAQRRCGTLTERQDECRRKELFLADRWCVGGSSCAIRYLLLQRFPARVTEAAQCREIALDNLRGVQ